MSPKSLLHQVLIRAEKSIVGQAASLLENSEPAPLSVSFYETEDHSWEAAALYQTPPDSNQLQTFLETSLDLEVKTLRISIEPLTDKDWVSHVQANLKPVKAGRFLIHGEHDRATARNQPFAIEVNAAQAFGTAHHGTTKGCLIAIDETANRFNPARILDLGTGTGILAIAAHMIWPKAKITASDIDPIAVTIATGNAAKNNIPDNAITFICADGLHKSEIDMSAPYNLIIANILAKPLILMANDIFAKLESNGRVILSGILDTQADEVIRAFIQSGLEHQSTDHHDEWVTVQLRRNE